MEDDKTHDNTPTVLQPEMSMRPLLSPPTHLLAAAPEHDGCCACLRAVCEQVVALTTNLHGAQHGTTQHATQSTLTYVKKAITAECRTETGLLSACVPHDQLTEQLHSNSLSTPLTWHTNKPTKKQTHQPTCLSSKRPHVPSTALSRLLTVVCTRAPVVGVDTSAQGHTCQTSTQAHKHSTQKKAHMCHISCCNPHAGFKSKCWQQPHEHHH